MPTTSWADTVSFCNGASAVLDPGTNATGILWETGSVDPTITVSTAGWYTVGLSIQTCNLVDSIYANVVYPNNFSLGSDLTVCSGSAAQLISTISGLWSTGVTNTQINVTAAGDYWQSGMYLGCAVSDTVHVFVQNPPVISLGNDTTLCYGNNLLLDAGISGTWSTGVTASSINVTNAGNYSFNYNDGVCTASDAIQVSLAYAPVATQPDSVTACSTSPITLDASTSGASTFLWNTGETSNSIVADDTGIFTIQASNQCGSINETIEVTYEDCNFSLYIPNTFTPNSDGDNDVWHPVFDRINKLEIYIYDRWGTQVFQGDLSNFYWVGNVRSGETYAEDGVYLYRILYSSDFGDDSEVNGHIILFR
jgi:gliding motility-associated-like protein